MDIKKINPKLKLFLLFIFSVLVFKINIFCTITFFLIFIFLAKKTQISIKTALADLKPIFYYAIFIYIATALQNKTLIVQKQNLIFFAKIATMMLASSLFFRTTTSLQLKNAITETEVFIKKLLHLKPSKQISNAFYFFLLFLPRTLEIWQGLSLSWKARGGKNNLKKLFILFPILISTCLHKTYKTCKAISARL